jgi:hypothetical protein
MERFAWVFLGVGAKRERSRVSKLSGSGLVRCRTDMIRGNVCRAMRSEDLAWVVLERGGRWINTL